MTPMGLRDLAGDEKLNSLVGRCILCQSWRWGCVASHALPNIASSRPALVLAPINKRPQSCQHRRRRVSQWPSNHSTLAAVVHAHLADLGILCDDVAMPQRHGTRRTTQADAGAGLDQCPRRRTRTTPRRQTRPLRRMPPSGTPTKALARHPRHRLRTLWRRGIVGVLQMRGWHRRSEDGGGRT